MKYWDQDSLESCTEVRQYVSPRVEREIEQENKWHWPQTSTENPKRNSYNNTFTSLSGLVYVQFNKSFSAAACWHPSADKRAEVILGNRCRFCSFKCSRASRLSQHAWCLEAALCLCMSQIKFGLTNPIWKSTDGPSWRRCWEESSFQVARRRTADWRSTASNNDWLSCTYVLGLVCLWLQNWHHAAFLYFIHLSSPFWIWQYCNYTEY